jgi:hypothetical protein
MLSTLMPPSTSSQISQPRLALREVAIAFAVLAAFTFAGARTSNSSG